MEESQPLRSSASSQPANRSQQQGDQQISPSRVSLDTSSIPLASSPTEYGHREKRLSSPTSNSLRDGKQLLSPGDDSIQDGKQPFSPTANSFQSDKQPASPAASSPREEPFSPPANSLQDDNQPPFPTEGSVNEVHLVEDSIAIEPAAPPHGDAEDAVTEFGTIFLYDKIVEEASVHDPSLVSAYKCDCQLVGHNQRVPLRALYAETPGHPRRRWVRRGAVRCSVAGGGEPVHRGAAGAAGARDEGDGELREQLPGDGDAGGRGREGARGHQREPVLREPHGRVLGAEAERVLDREPIQRAGRQVCLCEHSQ